MKISCCTTCMNRYDHISKTLPHNLKIIEKINNKKKHMINLSLCNYDSKDNLDEYIKDNYRQEIDDNILIYTKVNNKKIFNPGHAKNIAHKNSTGDILINVDADNFISEKFIYKIIELFENDINTITIGYIDENNGGGYGRIAINRNNFYKLGGYFENFIGYGMQDADLLKRGLKFLGLNLITLEKEYIDFISHDTLSRIINYDTNLYNLLNMKDFNNLYTFTDLDLTYNIELSEKYLKLNILNINEYNGINFGEY